MDRDRAIVNACITFGIAPPFSLDDSRRRFRELAKLYHPDAGKTPNSDMFTRLGAAFQVLEENAELLSRKSLGLQSPNAPSEKLIEELRQARLKTLKSEEEISSLKSETDALRSVLKGKDAASPLKYLIVGILIFGAVILGFMAGLTRGFQNPIGTFAPSSLIPVEIKSADKVTAIYTDNKTTSSPLTSANLSGTLALDGIEIEVESGKARIKDPGTTRTIILTTGTVSLAPPATASGMTTATRSK